MTDRDRSLVVVYLDDEAEPVASFRPPAHVQLDTRTLTDGAHELRVEAEDYSGVKGVRKIPFHVRNGPWIAVDGLHPGDLVEGVLDLQINAYGGGHEKNWEPSRAESPTPVPTWAWLLLLGVLVWSGYYVITAWSPTVEFAGLPTYAPLGEFVPADGAATSGPVSSASDGEMGGNLYRTSCASCHQGNGQGLPGAFPALAGSAIVTAEDPSEHVHVVLFGKVAMPAWKDQLSDAELTAIINHERTSWGNSAPTVTVEQVAAARAAGP